MIIKAWQPEIEFHTQATHSNSIYSKFCSETCIKCTPSEPLQVSA